MKHYLSLICTLCLLLILAGCGQQAETPPESSPETDAVQIESTPEPEPLPEMTDGDVITVNGQILPDGSWLIDEVLYVRLWSLTRALGAELTWSGEDAAFTWQDHTVNLQADSDQCQLDGTAQTLDGPMRWILDQAYVPVVSLCDLLGLNCYDDAEQSHLYFTPGAAKFEIPGGYHVPTLMYHAVSDNPWGETDLFVSPADLEAQLQYLQDNGYTTIHFADLARIDEIEKPVLLTFDDGYLDNYTELYPLLQKYQAKATIFVITDSIGTHEKYITWEQAAEMSAGGLVSIQSHTTSHPNLGTLSKEEQEQQMAQSKLAILRNTGQEPYVLCYPNGSYNQDTLDLMDGYYNFGLKMVGEDYYTDHSPYEINRWFVSRYTSLDSFISMVN